MIVVRVVLTALLVAFSPARGLAACSDPAAVAAARAAADAACDATDTGCATAARHGEYVSCIARQAKAAVKAGTLPKSCRGDVVRCAARSTCGKSGAVACCRTSKRGKASCAITVRCLAPKHGTACVASAPSCCDACAGATCVGPTTTSTTITTTTTSATTSTTFPDCNVAGNLVQNCGFETPGVPSGSFGTFGANDTSITGWTVAASPSGGVDLVNATFSGGYPVHGGAQSLDLSHDVPGAIAQDVPTTTGQAYRLTFFVAGFPAGSAPCPASDPKTMTVTAGAASVDVQFAPDLAASPPGAQQFVPESLDFSGAAGSTTTLKFTATNTGCAGPIIDDVVVLPTP
jgi:hypothetical protein